MRPNPIRVVGGVFGAPEFFPPHNKPERVIVCFENPILFESFQFSVFVSATIIQESLPALKKQASAKLQITLN